MGIHRDLLRSFLDFVATGYNLLMTGVTYIRPLQRCVIPWLGKWRNIIWKIKCKTASRM